MKVPFRHGLPGSHTNRQAIELMEIKQEFKLMDEFNFAGLEGTFSL